MLVFKARRKSPVTSTELTARQRRMMRTLGSAMAEVRKQVIDDEAKITDALLHSQLETIVNAVTVEPWLAIQQELADELQAELVSSGKSQSYPKMTKARSVGFAFDAPRAEAAGWASKEAGKLIKEIMDGQVATVRDYVSRSQMGEMSVSQVARNLRDVIGLTSTQAGWVENYRERFIAQEMDNGYSYREATFLADRPTERYQNRIHKYRSETIARTEILRANSEGRQESWRQAREQGFVSDLAQQQWVAEFDACPEVCSPINGMTIGINDEFPEGQPPAHPNCRCDVILVDPVADVPDFGDMSWEEIDALLADQVPANDTAELTLDEQIAQTNAEREPIRQQLVDRDAGLLEMSDSEYADLIAAHKVLYEKEMSLKQELMQEQKAPVVQPRDADIARYEQLLRDYEGDERAAFQDWQGDSYRRVQGSLNGGTSMSRMDPDIAEIIRVIDNAMDSLPQGTVLYRGQTAGLDNLQIGEMLSSKSYAATSTDISTAGAFSKSSGQVLGALKPTDNPTVMRITVQSAKGVAVPSSSEYEVLLKRGSKLTVTGLSDEVIDGVKYRIVDVVARG